MTQPVGYVVIEWNQASRRPRIADVDLCDDRADADDAADTLRAAAADLGRGETYTVHLINPSEDPE